MRFTAWIPAVGNEKVPPPRWAVGDGIRLECFGAKVGWATIVEAKADDLGTELVFDAELEPQS